MAGVSDVLAGRYRLVRAIGEGPHGEVFEAEQIGLDRHVAVKIPNDVTDFSRIEREARASMRIESAVRVLECVADHDPPFVVSELARGRSLRAMIGAVTPDRASRIARALLVALDTAHAAGVVHGDLRPSNIFVDGDRVQLADFGFDTEASDTSKTSTLAIRATIGYRAPERIRGAPASVRADVFSVGVCLYELIAGRRPFGDEIRDVLTEDPKPLDSPLWPAIEKALAKTPEARFANARETARALERRRTIWPFAEGLALVLVGIGAVLALTRHGTVNVLSPPTTQARSYPSASETESEPDPVSSAPSAPPSGGAVYLDFGAPGVFSADDRINLNRHVSDWQDCRRRFPAESGHFAGVTLGRDKATPQRVRFDPARGDATSNAVFAKCVEGVFQSSRLSVGEEGRTLYVIFPAPTRPVVHAAFSCNKDGMQVWGATRCEELRSKVIPACDRCLLAEKTIQHGAEMLVVYPQDSTRAQIHTDNIVSERLSRCFADAAAIQVGVSPAPRSYVVHVP